MLLFFTSSNRRDQNDTAITAYTDLCRMLDIPPIQQIVSDLEQCHLDDFVLFAHLIPYVYEKFATEAMGSAELMKLLAHSLDGRQIADLIGNFPLISKFCNFVQFFRKDSFLPIVSASLTWETTAQFIFWQLVHAEGVPIDWILQIIPKLQYPKHSEAIAQVYIMLQRYVCLDQLFAHLDKFRQSCLSKDSHVAEAFLARPVLQEAFTTARAAEKVSSLRIRYSELFAVMEILSDDSTQSARSLRRSKPLKKITDFSDDESRTVKRKRPKLIVESDSD
ncbi:unnamed protein product [Gongylonema pulchrum]|uniref:Ints3-like C-terminal domain-containing protein n=1 Tax=Gongylonema pulchrum TaxID=637853 RepID=A0A3P7P574_9BILA|nr:unnamed protein product [Gongylonema pulchrum]